MSALNVTSARRNWMPVFQFYAIYLYLCPFLQAKHPESPGYPAVDPSFVCPDTIENTKPKKIDENNKYNLWPGLQSTASLEHGEELFGMYEALEIIWRNQNPPDCSKAKYLFGEGWTQGFGSELHGYGVGLAVAIDMGRVFVQTGSWTWRYKNKHCESQNKHSLECYFLPFSNCTIKDALLVLHKEMPNVYRHPSYIRKGESLRNVSTRSKTHYTTRANFFSSTFVNMSTLSRRLFVKDNIHHHLQELLEWNKDEDDQLKSHVLQYGIKGFWRKICDKFDSKFSMIECKNRFDKLRKEEWGWTKSVPKNLMSVIKRDDSRPFLEDFTYKHNIYPIHKIIGGDEISRSNANHSILFNKATGEFYSHSLDGEKIYNISKMVIIISSSALGSAQKFIPRQLHNIVKCLRPPLQVEYAYLWWRTITALYFLRPNKPTLKLLKAHEDPILMRARGRCVSTYIRHGDKTLREMKHVPFSTYAKAALELFSTMNTTKSDVNRKIFYISSEDFKIFKEAKDWGAKNNVMIRYSNISQVILSDKKQFFRQYELEERTPQNHDMEYFSYILHLRDNLLCDYNVCTCPSNFCRLIDELRITAGSRANFPNAEVSFELCKTAPEPCIHYFGLGNHFGSVHDPRERLWRR